jgi:guanine nucleotide-binding protein G(I)/G(S)/G(T) subunit beta-1
MAKTGLEWGGESPEAEKGKKKKSKATRYVGHENGVNDAKFTGTTNFVTGSGDYRCAFWDISNPNSYIHPYSGHEGDVQSVAVCGEMFASGSCDCSAKLWDIRGTECVRTYADHDADINSVVISSDGKLLVTGSGDSTCIVYDLRAGGKPLITLEDQKNAQGVQSIDISPKGHHVVVGHENQIVRVWNLNTGNFEGIETGHTKKIGSVRFSKCGKLIAIGSHDQSTTIWSVPYAAGPASPKKKSKMKFSSFKKGKSPRNKS